MIEPRPQLGSPKLGQLLSPREAMLRALVIARKGAGFVSPNPMVGCVIVDREHRFLVEGWHMKVGSNHAEIEALERLQALKGSREALEGCHVYVTLEPCAHEGRTPSCAKTLAPLQPASVTFPFHDPNPLVAGKGAEILRTAGIRAVPLTDAHVWPALPHEPIDPLVKQELIDWAEDVAEIFLWNARQRDLPFVTVKVASTLDGKVALHSGESQWITGDLAREKGHRLRLEHDAILVGRRTVETDNPSLNVRLTNITDVENSVVIIDPRAKLLPTLKDRRLSQVRPTTKVFVCVQSGCFDVDVVSRAHDEGFQVFDVGGSEPGIIDLREALIKIRALGLMGLYVEGGAGTVGPFLDGGLAQRLHVFMSTGVLGGREATGWSDLCGVGTLAQMWKLKRQHVNMLDSDIHITGRLQV